MKQIIKKTLEIPVAEIEKWERLMTLDIGMLDLESEGIDPTSDTLAVWTVDFGDGVEMDIKVCLSVDAWGNGAKIWSEANLVVGGVESYSTDAQYELLGQWSVPWYGIRYAVEVIAK